MASPNATFTDIVTTTLREHGSSMSDNAANHNALYRRMKERGNIQTVDSGYEIVEPIFYDGNKNYLRYSGYDTLNIGAQPTLTAAKYDWVQAAIAITASGLETRNNEGSNRLFELASSRMKAAQATIANNMSIDIFSDGSLSNQMGGLGHLIQSAGTGTVGGIPSDQYPFWQNKFYEAPATPTTANIKSQMQQLYIQLTRGTDKPDLLVATHDLWNLYWESLSDLQRFTDSGEKGDVIDSVKFRRSDVVYDDNENFATNATKMYFLNTKYLMMKVHRNANWTRLKDRVSVNQDAEVVLLVWQGQMCCSNRRLQGILINEV